MSTEKPKPVPLVMAICDTIIDDRITGKKSLIGIFNNITAIDFPCRHQALYVYCVLTEGIGQYDGSLKCTHMQSGKPIITLNGPMQFNNPLATVELIFEIKNMTFEQEGTYLLELFCDNQPVTSRKISVSKMQKKQS
jgi:hypothetical protein